jgi:hypothetical protein
LAAERDSLKFRENSTSCKETLSRTFKTLTIASVRCRHRELNLSLPSSSKRSVINTICTQGQDKSGRHCAAEIRMNLCRSMEHIKYNFFYVYFSGTMENPNGPQASSGRPLCRPIQTHLDRGSHFATTTTT